MTTPRRTILVANAGQTRDQVVTDMSTLDLLITTGTFTPFAYTAASRQFTLQFRQKTIQKGTVRYTPTSAPYSLFVQRCN